MDDVTATPLRISLTRHLVRPGRGDGATAWMAALRERQDECVASLARDGLALEVVFRAQEGDDDVLYWFEIAAPDAIEHAEQVTEAERTELDDVHLAFAHEVKVPGHVAAEPQLVLIPAPVEEALASWLRSLRP